ncbi:MAG: alpha/beta hydrolase [Pseudomonadota bacterium]
MLYAEKFETMPDETKIYHRVYNSRSKRTPIICLPGITQNSKSFHHFATRRAQEFDDKVICIDMCGRGRSDYSEDVHRYDLMREVGDILHVMIMVEDIDTAHFVGTSRGAMQSCIIAGMRPDKVDSVVLNDFGCRIHMHVLEKITCLFDEKISSLCHFDDALKLIYQMDNGATQNLTPQEEEDIVYSKYKVVDEKYVCDYDREGIGQAYRSNLEVLKSLNPDYADFTALMTNIQKIPTLLLQGVNSTLLTDEIVKDTLAMLEHCTHAVIKDRGHVPLLTEKDTIVALDKFLPKPD